MKIICLTLGFWILILSFPMASQSQIQMLAFDQSPLPKEMPYKGKVVAGARWLDNNGIAESTFLYRLGCRSDLSPVPLKLIMHEGKAKYTLRGETMVPSDNPKEKLGGPKTIDPTFHRAPKVFLNYALQQWNTFEEEKFGE
jgi:hypothetical protein